MARRSTSVNTVIDTSVNPRIAVHGHAYQPPRVDPRTGLVPADIGAAPYRDWNHRITAECYAPCTATRLHDDRGRVVAIVNLFERMSFDLGPTLATWLAQHAPAEVSDACVASRLAGGHGHTLGTLDGAVVQGSADRILERALQV